MFNIDIKNDRELLGLPPAKHYTPPRFIKILGAALIVFLCASGVGRLLKMQQQQQKIRHTVSNYSNIINFYDTSKILLTLKQLKQHAAAGNSESKLLYSFACSYAAAIMPNQRVWLEEGLLQANLALKGEFTSPEFKSSAILQQSALLSTMGKEKAALKALQQLNKGETTEQLLASAPQNIEGGITYCNTYAYLLASATDKSIRNPTLALKLMQKLITLPNGRNASFLDTLAYAYYANNMRADALRTQRFALAKADYEALSDIITNYELFDEKTENK